MARSEEGGDLPIRKFTSGDYHIEGELVLASKERLYMYFKNCLNIFKLLEKLIVFFLSPLPRYLYKSCCPRLDHAPNIREDGFEERMRRSLTECRGFYKDFFFTSGFKNVTVLNPGMEVPCEDESCLRGMRGLLIWFAGRWRKPPTRSGREWRTASVQLVRSRGLRLRGRGG
jgi:hypothetical protein